MLLWEMKEKIKQKQDDTLNNTTRHRKSTLVVIYVPFLLEFENLMSVKLIYVLSSFPMLFLSILYPYSCKTHKISSKLDFVGPLMESK